MNARELSEELNFKVTVALAAILEDHQRGLVSNAEVKTAVKTLYDAVSGLVSQDTFDMISAVSADFKHYKGTEVTFVNVNGEIQGSVRICGNGALFSYTGGRPIRAPQYNTDMEVDAYAMHDQAKHKQELIQRNKKW